MIFICNLILHVSIRGFVFFVWEYDTLVNFADTAFYGNAPDVGAYEYQGTTQIVNKDHVQIHFNLFNNYPNPFNPNTKIKYVIPKSSHVVIKIFNILGEEIISLVDKNQQPGYYEVNWDGNDNNNRKVGSGIYFCKMMSEEFFKTIKLTLLK